MQIIEQVMPEFAPTVAVMAHQAIVQQLKTAQETKEVKLKEIAGNLSNYIAFCTEKLTKVILNICKNNKKHHNAVAKVNDTSPEPGVWIRQIGINDLPPIVEIKVDVRDAKKIKVNVEAGPECSKIFKTRINAMIKKIMRRN